MEQKYVSKDGREGWEHPSGRNGQHRRYRNKAEMRARLKEITNEISTIKNKNPDDRAEQIERLKREWNKLKSQMKGGEEHSRVPKGQSRR